MERCKYELIIEEYFGLNPDETTDKMPINTDFGHLCNLLSMFEQRAMAEITNENSNFNIPPVIKPLPCHHIWEYNYAMDKHYCRTCGEPE